MGCLFREVGNIEWKERHPNLRPRLMETLVKKWGNMSLNDREGGEVKLNAFKSAKKVTIAAKFLTKRALSTEAVIRLLIQFGGQRMGLRCVTWVTVPSYSSLTMRRRWRKLWRGNRGVLISI